MACPKCIDFCWSLHSEAGPHMPPDLHLPLLQGGRGPLGLRRRQAPPADVGAAVAGVKGLAAAAAAAAGLCQVRQAGSGIGRCAACETLASCPAHAAGQPSCWTPATVLAAVGLTDSQARGLMHCH